MTEEHRYPTLSGRDIITTCVGFWTACHAGDEGRSHKHGCGETEAAAIADLNRLDRERYEWEHEVAGTLCDEEGR